MLSLSIALTHGCRRRRLVRRGRLAGRPLLVSQLSAPSAAACQLGALTSSPSSSRRRSICLLAWQVSMQLFATLHIGSLSLSQAGPAYHASTEREREATKRTALAAPVPLCVRREAAAVGPVRPAVRYSVHAALVHSWQSEVHKNLKWAKVRWRLDMRGGLCCRGARRERARGARFPRGCPRRRRRAIATRNEKCDQKLNLSSLASP